MAKKSKRTSVARPSALYERIREILESAKASVARSVNTTQVVANWLIGREIAEEEQRGKKRADYGEQLLRDLAERLTAEFGGGFSGTNLRWFRQFYVQYPQLLSAEICHAMRDELSNRPIHGLVSLAVRGKSAAMVPDEASDAARRKSRNENKSLAEICHALRDESWNPGQLHSDLSWTHYRTLLKVESAEARAFYEIETIQNGWSTRELERQINSLLYDRLALSKDKKGVMRLAKKGQEITKPEDVFKDPVVMEFLGLPESPRLHLPSETELREELQREVRQLTSATPRRKPRKKKRS